MLNKEKREKLIISADDFGISSSANKNILELAERGTLDRVAVMIGGKIEPEEIARLLRSGVKIDIHFHLNGKDFYCCQERKINIGTIRRLITFLFNYSTGKARTKNIEIRWTKQMEEFRRIFGRYPDGINSHEHVHFFWPYFKVAISLGKKFNIKYVRLGRRACHEVTLVARILGYLREKNISFLKNSGLTTSDFMVSLDWLADMRDFLNPILCGRKVELVCHPEKEEELKILRQI